MMNKEREKSLEEALDLAKKAYVFSEKAKNRILERVPFDEVDMRNYIYAWLSCNTSEERDLLSNEKTASMSKNDASIFSLAFHNYILNDSKVVKKMASV